MFAIGQEVFPKWSQRLPAFKVLHVGRQLITVVDEVGAKAYMHPADLVPRDPNVAYTHPRYEALPC